MLLCKYEDLVIDPAKYFQRIFTFIDGEFSPHFIAKVQASSVNKHDAPEMGAEIHALCVALLAKIDARYQGQIKHEQTEALQQHS